MFKSLLCNYAEKHFALIYPTLYWTLGQRCTFASYFHSFLVTPAVSFQKKPIGYSLLINPSSLFAISAETGEISLTRPIDYESDQHRYLLLVRASEGLDSMSSAAEVCEFVCDVNSLNVMSSKLFLFDITRLFRCLPESVCNTAKNIWQVFKFMSSTNRVMSF